MGSMKSAGSLPFFFSFAMLFAALLTVFASASKKATTSARPLLTIGIQSLKPLPITPATARRILPVPP